MAIVKRISAFAGAFVLAGCSTTVPPLAGYQAKPSAVGFKIVDARPAEEKKAERLSMWVPSCDYDIYRMGDVDTTPARLDLLAQDLEGALGQKLSNATMTVTRYRIFFNHGAAGRAATNAATPGLAAAVITGMGADCTKEQTSGGWYANTEVSTPYSPFIIEIAATLKDKNYEVRTVFSNKEQFFLPRGPAVYDAMREAHKKLADQLNPAPQ